MIYFKSKSQKSKNLHFGTHPLFLLSIYVFCFQADCSDRWQIVCMSVNGVVRFTTSQAGRTGVGLHLLRDRCSVIWWEPQTAEDWGPVFTVNCNILHTFILGVRDQGCDSLRDRDDTFLKHGSRTGKIDLFVWLCENMVITCLFRLSWKRWCHQPKMRLFLR